MKTLFLLLLFLVFHLVNLGQGRYVSLKKCKNDTLQYALINFEQNKQRYIGKSMEMLLKELDFKIMPFFPWGICLIIPGNRIFPT